MKIFLFFFLEAIKIARSAQKNRVGRVSGHKFFFFFFFFLPEVYSLITI